MFPMQDERLKLLVDAEKISDGRNRFCGQTAYILKGQLNHQNYSGHTKKYPEKRL